MQKSAERPQIARAEPTAAKEKMSRHRRNGERVALRHYLARAAMERTAHRIPGTYYQREQICTAVLRAGQKKCPRLSRVPGILMNRTIYEKKTTIRTHESMYPRLLPLYIFQVASNNLMRRHIVGCLQRALSCEKNF